jgi:metal-responsive CopG/Arc/MetJ family transcriptional regulator
MVITLPDKLMEEANQVARQRGIEVKDLVVAAVERYLEGGEEEVSEARKRLRELSRRKKKTDDFMEAVHRAKTEAYRLYQANEEWIAQVMSGVKTPKGEKTG